MALKNQDIEFVEKFGLFIEKSGSFPRIAGKIFAYLLICEPPEQTQQEIAENLNIAKGSASNMIKLLIQTQIIEEFTKPKLRAKLYRIQEGGWEQLFLTKLQRLAVVRNLLEEGRGLLKNKPKELSRRINNLDNLYSFFEKELPTIISKYNRSIKKSKEVQ
jgi:DNA-binding transcriptional regulator GbsR (MarR family)